MSDMSRKSLGPVRIHWLEFKNATSTRAHKWRRNNTCCCVRLFEQFLLDRLLECIQSSNFSLCFPRSQLAVKISAGIYSNFSILLKIFKSSCILVWLWCFNTFTAKPHKQTDQLSEAMVDMSTTKKFPQQRATYFHISANENRLITDMVCININMNNIIYIMCLN